MVDWPSMCGTWMVGIKHLIQEIRRIQLMNGELIETREEKGINMPLRYFPYSILLIMHFVI